MEQSEFLGVEQLAALFEVTVPVIYGMRYRGDAPPAVRIGRELRFRRVDVDRWLEQRLAATNG
jgi:excisionase family DNA binding protein